MPTQAYDTPEAILALLGEELKKQNQSAEAREDLLEKVLKWILG